MKKMACSFSTVLIFVIRVSVVLSVVSFLPFLTVFFFLPWCFSTLQNYEFSVSVIVHRKSNFKYRRHSSSSFSIDLVLVENRSFFEPDKLS